MGDKPKLFVGVEDEMFFKERKGSRKLADFDALVERMVKIGSLKKESSSNRAEWNLWGGIVYQDGYTVEHATPLIEIGKGCAKNLVDAVLMQRANAIRVSRGYFLEGWSSHYNITLQTILTGKESISETIDNEAIFGRKGELELAKVLIQTLGPVYVALFLNKKSSGFMYRVRDERFELCGDYLPNTKQLEAATAFFIASIRGMESLIEKIAKNGGETLQEIVNEVGDTPSQLPDYSEKIMREMPIKVKNVMLRSIRRGNGYGVSRNANDYEKEIVRRGTNAELKTNHGQKKVLDIFKIYLDFFKKELNEIATEDELKLLHDYAEKKQTLTIDKGGWPKHYKGINASYIREETKKSCKAFMNQYKPMGVAELFIECAKDEGITIKDETAELLLEPQFIDWEQISFNLSFKDKLTNECFDSKKNTVYVKRDKMADFLSLIKNEKNPKKFYESVKKICKDSFWE
ncbi:hypothetical protein HY643_00400 [Candidatus Woesearchaeota archaeon]|nr:hypothetical protein [Candidatus Woesearchaeota archaeon]